MFSRRVLIFPISLVSVEGVLEVSGKETGGGVASLEMDELPSVFLDSPDSATVVAGLVGEEELGRI